MRRTILILSNLLWLYLGTIHLIFAQGMFENRKVGDWSVYEYLEEDERVKPKGIPNKAETLSDSHLAWFGVERCEGYSVHFRLGGSEFYSVVESLPEVAAGGYKIVYAKTNKDRDLWPILLERGEEWRFTADAASLVRAGTLMICPRRDEKEDSCFNFSLRGLTAALKLMCPKR